MSGTAFGAGALIFLGLGDSMDAGDPEGVIVGAGLVGLSGALIGLIADLVTPRPAVPVRDRVQRPTLRLSLLPEGSSQVDRYVLGGRIDPQINLSPHVTLNPHFGFAARLGADAHTHPVPGIAAPPLRTQRHKVSGGAELAFALPYPIIKKKPGLAGPVELRWRPMWELRRRTLHPGADRQVVEHHALYPATLGVRWHVTPRQRFTVYLGPRMDWLGYTDPGGDLQFGSTPLMAFHGEAWWQLDVPVVRQGQGEVAVTSRINVGYVHSNLDGQRFDLGAIIGYFGPFEISTDLRFRKRGAPVALQLTAGARVGSGGGPFVEFGVVTPALGGSRG